jgi:8-amino-7-oxononanoate synthase
MSASNLKLDDALERELRALAEAGLRRDIPPQPTGVDFVSSDFLGLARNADVIDAVITATRDQGAGSTSARLLGGDAPAHRVAEREAADWLAAEDALLFPTGYQANLGLLGALAGPGDLIVSDELAHASLIDGARLSRARVAVFRHNDVEHARSLLSGGASARRRLIVTEGVFSMDGDVAPLAELAALAQDVGAHLIVDEAHATGLIGPEGAGAWAAAEAQGASPSALAARVVTGGKALGLAGAFVIGSSLLRDVLIHRARSFVFTTAPPPGLGAGLAEAMRCARQADGARDQVAALAQRLADRLGLPKPAAGIVPVPIGGSDEAMRLAAELRNDGLEVRAVRPPTVPRGSARLRITLHASNTADQVDRLAGVLVGRCQRRPAVALTPKARALAIVGTDTDVGKTVAAALLARAAARLGETSYWKPVQTGTDLDTDTVRQLCAGTAVRFHEPTHQFPLPASPHEAAADAGGRVDPDLLERVLAGHRSETDGWLIVEPAGGLHVPLTDEVWSSDWLARVRPELVLVGRSGLGTLNHTLLSIEALRARALNPRALFLMGEPHASNRRTLEDATGLIVHEVPVLEPLDAQALDAWLDAHDLGSLLR